MVDWHKLIPATYIYGAFGAVLTAFGTIVVYIARKVVSALKEEWVIVSGRLERIENVQGVQAENHLATIQGNTARSNELLDAMRLEQAETNGYLRAVTHGYMKNIVDTDTTPPQK